MSAQEGLVAALDAAQEWMRRPDHDDEFSLADLTDWVNARPISVIPDAKARITSLESELAEAQFGFERELALKQELAAHVVVLRAENARLLAHNATLREAARKYIEAQAFRDAASLSDDMVMISDAAARLVSADQDLRAGHEQASPTMTAEQMRPLAWRFEAADAMEWRDGKPYAPTNWSWRISETKPCMGDAMRNVTPLYALPASPGKGGE